MKPVYYANASYARVEGKTVEQLEAELRVVYESHPEYSDPACGPADFELMVLRFATDDFYNLHYVAQRYLILSGRATLGDREA